MLRKQCAGLIALAVLPGLTGCAQATRHSNTMVFGTNTTVGLKVGRDVNQMPVIMIAYDRQEAVIMPLLANTGERSGSGNLLSPCPATKTTRPTPPPTPPFSLASIDAYAHPCKFVAIREGRGGLKIQDSYSVLASFGARIEGEAADAKGTVGIAQYFSTGAAAQTLAMTGGAAVVSVGEAAGKAADNPVASANAAAALGANQVAAEISMGLSQNPEIALVFDTLAEAIISKIRSTNDTNLSARLAAFDAATQKSTGISADLAIICKGKSPTQCADEMPNGYLVIPTWDEDAEAVMKALENWKTP